VDAREAVLARVRASGGAGGGGGGSAPAAAYVRAGALTRAERLLLLRQRIEDYRARVVETPAADLAATIEHELADRTVVTPPGLPEAWRPPSAIVDDGLSVTELDAVAAVLTGCTLAIAETGTLVLTSGPTEGRRALTLVPDLHVCVVFADQVVETVPEAFDALRGHERDPITLISGPSATSDIELSRVEGVHGPRTLVVVLAT
jgi:L-lactate dehydrogenase complex protein LldG